jgi:hypothetical protein
MIDQNPHLKYIERTPYELGYLLLELPRHIIPGKKYSDDVYQMADAARQHASNGLDTLLFGLEAIGSLMVDAGVNKGCSMEPGTSTTLGELIRYMSVEIQFLSETERTMSDALKIRDESAPQKGGA